VDDQAANDFADVLVDLPTQPITADTSMPVGLVGQAQTDVPRKVEQDDDGSVLPDRAMPATPPNKEQASERSPTPTAPSPT